jgi:hypothetical protein
VLHASTLWCARRAPRERRPGAAPGFAQQAHARARRTLTGRPRARNAHHFFAALQAHIQRFFNGLIHPGCAGKPEVDDEAPTFVRLSLEAVTKLRLHENGELEALVAAHAREKQALHAHNAALAALVTERLGATALEEASSGEVAAGRESDAGVYCALLLAGQAQARRVREEAEVTVAAAALTVEAAEARASGAHAARVAVEERCAEPLRIVAELTAATAREATALADARYLRSKLEEERAQRERLQLLLDGDAHTLKKLPPVQLEALLSQLSRARDSATAALVDARVAERRAAEAEAMEAEARRRAEAENAEAMECAICCAAAMDTALDCGHRSCGACAAKLSTCHICRGQVKSRLKLY